MQATKLHTRFSFIQFHLRSLSFAATLCFFYYKVTFLFFFFLMTFSVSTVHFAYIQNKISKITGILCKTRHYVSLKVSRMLYYALIYPYLHYGNIIWANTYQSNLDPLIKLQKKIIRIISFAGYKDHTPPIFNKLSILPFDQINEEKTALFMFRYFKGEVHSRMAIYSLYANKKVIQKYVIHQNFSFQRALNPYEIFL